MIYVKEVIDIRKNDTMIKNDERERREENKGGKEKRNKVRPFPSTHPASSRGFRDVTSAERMATPYKKGYRRQRRHVRED